MAPLIRPNMCGTCKFAAAIEGATGVIECHYNPPHVSSVMIGIDKGTKPPSPMWGTTARFPRLQVDDWCGQHVPKILQ